MSDELYGLTEEQVESRREMEKSHEEFIRTVVDGIKQTLYGCRNLPKGKKERIYSWKDIVEEFRVKKTNERAYILFEILNHENIVSDFNQERDNATGEYPSIARTVYWWKEADEKERLGFDSVKYKVITEKHLRYIKERFRSGRTNTHNEILCFIDYMLKCEADKGFVPLDVMKNSTLAGMPIKTFISVINELVERGLMVTTTVYVGNEALALGTLVFSDEDREKALKEKENDSIKIHKKQVETRRRRKYKAPVDAVITQNKQLAQAQEEEKALLAQSPEATYKALTLAVETYHKVIEKEMEKQKEELQKNIDKYKKYSEELKQARARATQSEQALANQKIRVDAYRKHIDKKYEDIMHELMVLQLALTQKISEMSREDISKLRDPAYVNQLKAEFMKPLATFSNFIMNTTNDKPDETF